MEDWQVILLLVGLAGLLILLFILIGVRWVGLDESKWPGNSRLACMIREMRKRGGPKLPRLKKLIKP
jgi:hypothetical protein